MEAIEVRTSQNEHAIDKLTEIVQGIAVTVSQVNTAIQLLQQSASDLHNIAAKNQSSITSLQEKSNLMRGGWLALCAIGSVIVILSGVVGALVSVLALRK